MKETKTVDNKEGMKIIASEIAKLKDQRLRKHVSTTIKNKLSNVNGEELSINLPEIILASEEELKTMDNYMNDVSAKNHGLF